MKISIVSPMYNEQDVIADSIRRVHKKMSEKKVDYELILVNDGSTDNTLEVATKESKKYSEVKIVSYPKNAGRGKALRTGFEYAKGDMIVTVESDSTWGEDIIIDMVELLKKNSNIDFVIASPNRKGGGYANVPLLRKFYSHYGNKILAMALGNDITMASGMTRAYRREVIDSLNLFNDGKEIHLEILSKALGLGYKVAEIPATITWKNKSRGKKRKSTFNAKKLIYSHLMFSFNESPILLLGSIGLFFIMIGIISGAYLLYTYLIGELNPQRPLVIFMMLTLIVGIQIILFTFLAYQKKDLYKEELIIQKELKGIKRMLKK